MTKNRLRIEAEVGIHKDLEIFVSRQVSVLAMRWRYIAHKKSLVTKMLLGKANGIFLWVSLTVKDLCKTPAKVRGITPESFVRDSVSSISQSSKEHQSFSY
jgi:hypothetical protein